MATWTDEDLSNAFRSAQAKEVRTPLALELQRRRAEREKQGRGAALTPATTSTPSKEASMAHKPIKPSRRARNLRRQQERRERRLQVLALRRS
ncbi:hypothetical protein JQN63_11470 [Delftia lacustris]|nr:hypothetical protein [Delftia lacustris]QRI92530.1 hypothetical protein JQN63_11470 [Delftia lacustris]